MVVRVLSLILSLGCLTACSGVHKADYTWLPPQGAVGSNCVQKCLLKKQDCIAKFVVVNQAAKDIPKNVLAMTNGFVVAEQNITDRVEYKSCTKNHMSCYKSCGGKILINKRCVINCATE